MAYPGIYRLSYDEYFGIINCVQQHLIKKSRPNEPYVITVWFHDVANEYLHTNTPSNAYAIYDKPISKYTIPYIIKKANNIWNSNLIPIEVIQITGGFFYSIPKKFDIENIKMLPSEDNIPELSDF